MNTYTDIHALSEIRTHDPSVRANEDSSCLRPRGLLGRLLQSCLSPKITYTVFFPCILHDRSILSCLTFMSIKMLSGVQIINLLFIDICPSTGYFFFRLHHFDTFRVLICFVLFQGNIQNVRYTRSFMTRN
jgi:hypothetical protein